MSIIAGLWLKLIVAVALAIGVIAKVPFPYSLVCNVVLGYYSGAQLRHIVSYYYVRRLSKDAGRRY